MDTIAPHTTTKRDPTDEPIATKVAAFVFLVCVVLLATGTVHGIGIIGAIGFCIFVPSVAGSMAGWFAQQGRGSEGTTKSRG